MALDFQFGVGLGQREQPPQRAAERALGLGQLLHRRRIAGIALGGIQAADRAVARADYRLQRVALVLHVGLHCLDQIRDQVVATGQLHVDLGEGVAITIAAGDKAVVDADRPEQQGDADAEHHQQEQERDGHGFSLDVNTGSGSRVCGRARGLECGRFDRRASLDPPCRLDPAASPM